MASCIVHGGGRGQGHLEVGRQAKRPASWLPGGPPAGVAKGRGAAPQPAGWALPLEPAALSSFVMRGNAQSATTKLIGSGARRHEGNEKVARPPSSDNSTSEEVATLAARVTTALTFAAAASSTGRKGDGVQCEARGQVRRPAHHASAYVCQRSLPHASWQ